MMQVVARFRFLCVLLFASAPMASTKLGSWLLCWRAALLARLRAVLGSQTGLEEAGSLKEPPERRELAARFGAQLPSWESLRAVEACVREASDWKEALASLERYEKLFDFICYGERVGRPGELSLLLRSQLLVRLALYLDFRSALQAPGLTRGGMGRLRGLYLKLAAGHERPTLRARAAGRSGVLEDLWRYTQIDGSDARKPKYLLFEARALSFRYDLDVEVLAYIALFGIFVWEFRKKAPRRPVDDEDTDEELACLFQEAWRCILSERETEPRPFFSELAALQMGLSIKPKRA